MVLPAVLAKFVVFRGCREGVHSVQDILAERRVRVAIAPRQFADGLLARRIQPQRQSVAVAEHFQAAGPILGVQRELPQYHVGRHLIAERLRYFSVPVD